jgi:NTE family protein
MRALVLSGGGSKGAYQVGVLRYLTEQGLSWDIVCGVSVGALNGSFISQYEKDFQRQGAMHLEMLWKTIKGNRSIYRTHTLGQLGRILEGGLFSAKPLRDMIYDNLDRTNILASGVKLHVGAISCTTGEYRSVDEMNENLHDWIVASSAFPVAFPPVKIDGDTWTDGGIGKYSPLSDVLPYIDEITEIDFIATEPIESIISIPEHIKVNIYCPKEPLGIKPLSFDAKKIEELMILGWDQAHSQFVVI